MKPFTDGSTQMPRKAERFIITFDAGGKSAGSKTGTALDGDSYRVGSASQSVPTSSRLVNVLVTGRGIPSRAKRAPDIWPPMSNEKAAT